MDKGTDKQYVAEFFTVKATADLDYFGNMQKKDILVDKDCIDQNFLLPIQSILNQLLR